MSKINIHTHSSFNDNSIQNYCIGTKGNISEAIFSAGIHPWHIHSLNLQNAFKELFFISSYKKLVAIGECGIDKFAKSHIKIQIEIFERQLLLAEQLNLPIIVHCVRSYDLILNLRKKYAKTPWIVHDFSGNIELANQLIGHNIYISFGNNFMKKSHKILDTARRIDLNFVFLETDTDKFDIDEIYEQFSLNRKINIEQLENKINSNFKKVFQK